MIQQFDTRIAIGVIAACLIAFVLLMLYLGV